MPPGPCVCRFCNKELAFEQSEWPDVESVRDLVVVTRHEKRACRYLRRKRAESADTRTDPRFCCYLTIVGIHPHPRRSKRGQGGIKPSSSDEWSGFAWMPGVFSSPKAAVTHCTAS
jgi:hypothetical protein